MDSSLSLRPAIQLAGLILGGLFFLNQTRKQGLLLSLLCMLAWLGAVFLALGIIRQQGAQVGGSISISKRVELIDEISLIQLDPIIETETEQVVVILPNEEPQVQAPIRSGSWANVPTNVARWQPYIMKSIAHCGLTTPGYDPALLIAAIVMQESSGNPNAMGAAHDTGLAQVVNRSHPLFPNRPSREELLEPQFNLNFASCLLKDNLKYTGSVEAAVNAYNGNGIHNGQTYAQIIFGHYTSLLSKDTPTSRPHQETTSFGSYPVSGRPRITQNFHSGHPGLDIVGSGDILAVMDGTVQYVGPLYKSANSNAQCVKAGCLGAFSIVLDHGHGTFTIYGHNSCTYVQAGQQVKAGQPIACMGSEGRSTGPHLHFELRKNETWNGNPDWPWQGSYLSAVNPTSYFP